MDSRKVQCRICHEEDEVSHMETPCSCRGTLKYAHGDCVEKWCIVKGDVICEICQNEFSPDYAAHPPPSLEHRGGSTENSRGNWEDIDFEYLAPSARTVVCHRIVATMFIALLVLKLALSILLVPSGVKEFSIVLMLLLAGIIGVLLPLYIMVKATSMIQRVQHQRRRRPSHPANRRHRSH